MQTNDFDRTIFDLASAQHGAVARRQLRAVGVDDDHIRRRLAQTVLQAPSPRTIVVAGSPDTIHRRLMVAALDVGPPAALSHATAAWIWDLPGFLPDEIHVTGRHSRTSHGRSDLAVLHQPRRLFDRHIVEVNGLPVTTPARTIFDLANLAGANAAQIERLLDRAWSRRLLDHHAVQATLDDLAVRGRAGITLMRELLGRRPVDHAPTESNLEARFRDVLGAHLGGQFRVQVNVWADVDWIGRVDFIHDDAGLVVEVDSTTYHTTITDRRRDEARQAKLEALGLRVLRVREHDLWHDPAGIVAAVRRAINDHRRTGARNVA